MGKGCRRASGLRPCPRRCFTLRQHSKGGVSAEALPDLPLKKRGRNATPRASSRKSGATVRAVTTDLGSGFLATFSGSALPGSETYDFGNWQEHSMAVALEDASIGPVVLLFRQLALQSSQMFGSRSLKNWACLPGPALPLWGTGGTHKASLPPGYLCLLPPGAREPVSLCQTLAALGDEPHISRHEQRSGNQKNICGNLSHLWMTARSLLSERNGTHRKQRGT